MWNSWLAFMMKGVWAILLLVWLAGCSDTLPGVDPVLYAEDGWMQRFDRHFRPRIYWSEKVEVLQGRADQSRVAFREGFRAYQQLLRERRQFMARSMAVRRAAGQDPLEGRREAVQKYRDDLARLRQENREMGKKLRQEDVWLSQAQQALYRSR